MAVVLHVAASVQHGSPATAAAFSSGATVPVQGTFRALRTCRAAATGMPRRDQSPEAASVAATLVKSMQGSMMLNATCSPQQHLGSCHARVSSPALLAETYQQENWLSMAAPCLFLVPLWEGKEHTMAARERWSHLAKNGCRIVGKAAGAQQPGDTGADEHQLQCRAAGCCQYQPVVEASLPHRTCTGHRPPVNTPEASACLIALAAPEMVMSDAIYYS